MNKKKLLVIHPALAPYRVEFFNEIAKHVHLKVYLLRDNLLSQKFNKEDIFSKVKFDCTVLQDGLKIGSREFKFGLLNKIAKIKPDTIVTHEYSIQTMQLLVFRSLGLLKNVKIVTWTDDNQSIVRKPQSFIRKIARTYCLRKLDSIICLSDIVREEYKEYLNFQKPIGVAPLLHEEITFRNELNKNIYLSNKLRAEYNLENKYLIFVIGRLAPEKGFDSFLNAISIIPEKERAKMNFIFIGDGILKNELKRLSKSLMIDKEVKFLGRKEGKDLYSWFNLIDLLVVPSYHELFGAVVNEALISGAFVACSNVVGAKILIKDNKNGYIFPVGDTSKLAEIIVNHCNLTTPDCFSERLELKESLMHTSFNSSIDGWLSVV